MVIRAASSNTEGGEYEIEDEAPVNLVRHRLTGKAYRVKKISDDLP